MIHVVPYVGSAGKNVTVNARFIDYYQKIQSNLPK